MAKTRTSFKKGQVANPNGRPKKGYSITEWFKEMLNSKPEVKDAIGKSILSKALEGDPAAQRMVWQYMDGMPHQSVDYKGELTIKPILGGSTAIHSNNSNPQAIEANQED